MYIYIYMYIHVHIHSIYIYILHILVTYLACFINFINSIPPQDAKCPEVVRDADLRTDDSLPPQPGTMATYALKRSLRFALLWSGESGEVEVNCICQ